MKTEHDFFTFLDMQEQLSVLVGVPVDLVSSNGLSEFIKPIIDEEKRLIYERKHALKNPDLQLQTLGILAVIPK